MKTEKLLPPAPVPTPETPNREAWIQSVCDGFVTPQDSNRTYYRVILEYLWPKGHGIPGPVRTEAQIRDVINSYRTSIGKIKPYNDPFRRVRELQGEEGVSGIARVGRSCQLQHTDLSAKRVPRVGLSDDDWEQVCRRDGERCTVCKRTPPEVSLQQDHRIPRLRGGGDLLDNWQPLCEECNNFKSTACRGCNQNCGVCPWAFPEKYAPIKITEENSMALRDLAKKQGEEVSNLTNQLLEKALSCTTPKPQ